MPNRKKISIIALIILFIGIIGSIFTYSSTMNQTDWETEKKTFNPDKVQKIEIDNNNAKVEILSTNDENIKVEYRARNSDEQLAVKLNESTLSIQIKDSKKWFNFGLFRATQSLKVLVPEKDYEQLTVMNNNGSIHLKMLTAKKINLLTDNGKVGIEDVEGSLVHASSNNGQIEIKNVLANQVEVKTKNGRVMLENIEGDISSQSNNGAITFKTIDLNQSLDFETDNGKITIQTEQEPTNAVLDLRADNGKIDVFEQSKWASIIGDGDHLIKLVTKNGGITITK